MALNSGALGQAAAGDVARTDHNLVTSAIDNGFPLQVVDGGTGATTLTDGGILLGSVTGAITAMSVLADGSIIVGDGATDPVELTAFTSSTGTLKHEKGGVEADISAIADGGIVVGTGAGTMAIRASALTGGASGYIKHELGGIEADISAVAIGDIVVGTGTGSMALVTSTGHSDGDVLTRQADGSVDYESPSADIVGDTTPQLGGFLDPNSNYIGKAKGGDIASADPLVVGTDGDYFDVTGTTNFSAMTVTANRLFVLQFDGVLTMTHHATNLDLPGEANITTAVGDSMICFSTGSNTVQVVNYTKADGTAVAVGTVTHENGGTEADLSAVADGDVVVGTGTGTMGLESGATFRTTVGLGTGDSPQFTDLTLTGDLTGDTLGFDATDYIQHSDNANIGFIVNGNEQMRIESDGDLHADGDVIAYSTTISDERLKENIQPIEDALIKVNQLNGCTFTYIADGKESAGLIAQDVEKVLPSAVIEKELPLKIDDGKEYKVLQYDQTIGLLVEAIKELTAKVEALEGR